jgi:hypothetical protein
LGLLVGRAGLANVADLTSLAEGIALFKSGMVTR